MGKLKSYTSLSAVFLVATLHTLPAASASAEEEYYTWVDENGVTNYAEKKPQGYNATLVGKESRFGYHFGAREQEPEQAKPESQEEPDAVETEEDIDRHIAGERARIDQEIAAAKRSNCQIGKRNLAQLEAYARIRVKDEDGKERVLDDNEKASRIEKAKKTIRENCSG